MAYVAPNSDLWLCRGVPLDSEYHYSYRPASASAQQTAILAYKAFTLTNQSYIRHTNNAIRVAISPDNALGCNYMAFRNTSFGNKMFYAFITDVEYVNNETSLITYSIDVLQTYFLTLIFYRHILSGSIVSQMQSGIVLPPSRQSQAVKRLSQNISLSLRA